MENIVVVATVIAKPEFENEVYNELTKLHKNTHENSKGFLRYDFHKSLEQENRFVFVETWENSEYLEKHINKQYFKDAVINLDGKVENIDINKLKKLK